MPYWFDGNNLIGQCAATMRRDSKTRRQFLELLSGYSRTRGGHFTVYFDGDDPDRSLSPRGVRVRFSAPLSADDAILLKLRETGRVAEVIVVTNDHALAGRCRNTGAKTMDWGCFMARMTTGPTRRRQAGEIEEKIDLEEWARFFDLELDRLNER